MSSDVWNVAKQTDAKTMYETYTNGSSIGARLSTTDRDRLGKIIDMCIEMSEEFEQIIEDQNNYIIEFDSLEDDYVNKQYDIQQEIERLLQEVKELEQKEEDGTITDEERNEQTEKKGRLDALYSSSTQESNNINNKINENKAKIQGTYNEKEAIASNYSNFAITKGKDFLDKDITEKEEKGEKITFTPWALGKYLNHVAGESAIAAGENLQEKIEESTGVDKKISSKRIH